MITSLLDTDIYKFYMQQAMLKFFCGCKAVYKFKDRDDVNFTPRFVQALKEELKRLSELSFKDHEIEYLRSLGTFEEFYLNYLRTFHLNYDEISIRLVNNKLSITISGDLCTTMMWETFILSTISEIYFSSVTDDDSYTKFKEITLEKLKMFEEKNVVFAEFGTRRRRSLRAQEILIDLIMNSSLPKTRNYIGTSNAMFSELCDTQPIGTMAHEWIMLNSAKHSIQDANKMALKYWTDLYHGKLAVALPDTFTTKFFFRYFDQIQEYRTFRHDSGNPFEFIKTVDEFYSDDSKEGISLIFSDSINSIDLIDRIMMRCRTAQFNASFGIGTWLTNDFETKPLNIVIKQHSVDDIEVIKISDDVSKATGNREVINQFIMEGNLR